MDNKKFYNENYMPKVNRIGKITGYLGVVLAFAPAIMLAIVYGILPKGAALATAFIAGASSFGVLWFVEPISYFPVVGSAGTYMAFLPVGVPALRKHNRLAAFAAFRRLELGRVRHFLPVVLVSAVPCDHLRLCHLATFGTCLPVALVPVVVVIGAQGVATVIPVAAIMRIRKRHVLVFVVAYPLAAALRADEVLRRAADEALLLFFLSFRHRTHSFCHFSSQC